MKKVCTKGILKMAVKITFKQILSMLLAFLAVLPLAGCTDSEISENSRTDPLETVTIQYEPKPEVPSEPEVPPEPEYIYRNTFEQNREAVDAAVDEIAKSYGVMGCSVAVFEKDSIVYTHSYGIARYNGLVKDGEKWSHTYTKSYADENTKYRVASISKLVTTFLAMQLVDKGELNLEDDIAQLINPALQNPYYPETPTTVEMLMSHTSGIVDGGGWDYAVSHVPFPSLDKVIKHGVFSGDRPGEKYCYSNIGMGLVAGAIEQASGQRFYDYADSALFEPMGIDAAYMTDYIEDRGSIAELRQVDPLSWGKMEKYYTANIPLGQMYLLGQAELYISAPDLARIAIILAGDGTYEEKTYLSRESLESMHKEHAFDAETNMTRGLAVQITPDILEGVTLYGHQGNAYGSISCVFYDPKTSCGVVFLTNGASAMKENNIYSVNDAIVKEMWKYLQPEGKQ